MPEEEEEEEEEGEEEEEEEEKEKEDEEEILGPSQWPCAKVNAAATRCHHSYTGSTLTGNLTYCSR